MYLNSLVVAGENLVPKSQVQMQTTGKRKSHGRAKPTQSGKKSDLLYSDVFLKP